MTRVAAILLGGCLYVSTSDNASAPSAIGVRLECAITRYCGHSPTASTIKPCVIDFEAFVEAYADTCHAELGAQGCPGYLCVIDCEDTHVPCLLDGP